MSERKMMKGLGMTAGDAATPFTASHPSSTDMRKMQGRMNHIRRKHREGRLDLKAANILESVPGFSWDPKGDVCRARFEALRQFSKANGGDFSNMTANIFRDKDGNEHDLTRYIRNLRTVLRGRRDRGQKQVPSRVRDFAQKEAASVPGLMEAIGSIRRVHDESMLSLLGKLARERGGLHWLSSAVYVPDERENAGLTMRASAQPQRSGKRGLESWAKKKRSQWKKGLLDEDLRRRLEAVPGWVDFVTRKEREGKCDHSDPRVEEARQVRERWAADNGRITIKRFMEKYGYTDRKRIERTIGGNRLLEAGGPTSRSNYSKGETRPLAKLTDDDIRRLCRDIGAKTGRARRAICEKFSEECGVSFGTIWPAALGETWKHITDDVGDWTPATRPGLPNGEKNHNAKLTDTKASEIRRRHAAGESQSSLAREYGVGRKTVTALVQRRTWRHVD